jgi:hypothetical protein
MMDEFNDYLDDIKSACKKLGLKMDEFDDGEPDFDHEGPTAEIAILKDGDKIGRLKWWSDGAPNEEWISNDHLGHRLGWGMSQSHDSIEKALKKIVADHEQYGNRFVSIPVVLEFDKDVKLAPLLDQLLADTLLDNVTRLSTNGAKLKKLRVAFKEWTIPTPAKPSRNGKAKASTPKKATKAKSAKPKAAKKR